MEGTIGGQEREQGRREEDRRAPEIARLMGGDWLIAAAGRGPAAYALADAEGRVVTANARLAELSGHPGPTLPSLRLADLVHADDRDQVTHLADEAMADPGSPTKAEVRLDRPDGAAPWVTLRLEAHDQAGRRWLLASMVETTRVHDLGDALRQANEAVATLARGDELAVFGCDRDLVVQSWNEAAERVFGRTAEEMVGTALSEEVLGDGLAVLEEAARGTQFVNHRADGRRRSGQSFPARFSIAPVPGDDAVVAIVVDVTDDRLAGAFDDGPDGRLRKLLGSVGDTVTVLDPSGALQFTLAGAGDPSHPPPEHWLEQSPLELAHPDDTRRASALLERCRSTPGLVLREELRLRHAPGHWERTDVTAVNLAHDPDVAGLVITTRARPPKGDLPRRLAEQAELVESIARSDSLPGSLAAVARSLERDLGEGHVAFLVPEPPDRLLSLRGAVSLPPAAAEALGTEAAREGPLVATAREGGARAGPCPPDLRHEGYAAWWLVPLSPGTSLSPGALVVLHPEERLPTRDERNLLDAARRVATLAAGRARVERRLLRHTGTDPVTGLPNRRLLLDRLRDLLRQDPVGIGVLLVDVDRFTSVNESLGQTAGDQLLATLASRLQLVVRPPDLVARFGADEFAVVIGGVAAADELRPLANRLRSALRPTVELVGGEVQVSAGVGVAAAAGPDAEADALLGRAAAALDRAKRRGTDKVDVFDEHLHAGLGERLSFESALHQAARRGELDLQFQPACDLASGAVLGFEALVRWRHPTMGVVPPDRFIPVAEDIGAIGTIGAWVLDEALRLGARWRQDYPGWSGWLSVNISSHQLEPALVEQVDAALARHDWPARDLVLELTETSVIDDPEEAAEVLRTLRARGLRIAIDDFGTGHSALSYLDQFPCDLIKIDRSFVDGLGAEGQRTAIPSAIIGMAAALDLTTVAEGVEDEAQVEALLDLGCSWAQGFHLGRPLWTDEVAPLLSKG